VSTFLFYFAVIFLYCIKLIWWWFGAVGSVVDCINEVNQHQARLVLGWVTIRVCNHPPRSTQPGHPSVVGAMSTSESWDVNRHTAWCTGPVSEVSQCEYWCFAEG